PLEYEWLLAHLYSGVVWGRREADSWKLSSGLVASSPPLDASALLQLRVFGDRGEIFVWRSGGQLYAREIVEEGEELRDCLDEAHVVWGSKGQSLGNGFTRLEDGEEGLVHAVPLPLGAFDARSFRPVRLHVRHYLVRDDETGLARIGSSRLRTLTYKKVNGNGS